MIESKNMFYGASQIVFENARQLRQNMTDAEEFLWRQLSNKKLNGIRYKPQHPIFQYIADFYCHRAKLIIEIDGEIHTIPENHRHDVERESEIREYGIEIIRFTNQEVLFEIDNVINKISDLVNERINFINETKSPLQGI